jgi:hypothetical protein
MPTDSLTDLVSISSIDLVPRRLRFTEPAGRQPSASRKSIATPVRQVAVNDLHDLRVPPGSLLVFGRRCR